MKVKLIHLVLVILLTSNLGLGVAYVHNTMIIEAQQQWIEDEIAGEHEPIEIKFWYQFYVDEDFPLSKLIIIEDGEKHEAVLDTELDSERGLNAGTGSNAYIEWLVRNYTVVIYDWTWSHWNGYFWEETYAWDIEYTNWVSVYEGPVVREYHCYDFHITLLSEMFP